MPLEGRSKRYFWKVAIAALIGASLAAMDFELFLAGIPVLIPLFNLGFNNITFMTDAMFIGSAVGAFAFGYLADKYGRKTIFMLMTIIYAIGSLFTAFSSFLTAFMGSRAFTGIGTGGDESLGFTLAAEEAPPSRRTWAMMIVGFSFPIGTSIGAGLVLLFVAYHIYLPYVFLVGVLPALFVIYLRKGLSETSRFQDIKRVRDNLKAGKEVTDAKFEVNTHQALRNTVSQMFSKEFRTTSILLAIFVIYLAGVVAVDLIFLPLYFIDVKGISVVSTLTYEFIGYGLVVIGVIYASYLGQKIGRKYVLVINLIASALLVAGMVVSTSPTLLLVLYVLFQVFLWSMWAAWPFYINETYPTRMRATASNFGYGFQWVGNIIIPTFFAGALAVTGGNWSIDWIGLIIIPLFILIAFLVPMRKSSAVEELESNAT